MRSLLHRLAALLPAPRVIMDFEGVHPYLSRYYLLGRPRMPDGSTPFDEFGDMRAGAMKSRWPGLYLHRFHQSDGDRELHSHPWRWAFSLILCGGYVEERRARQYWKVADGMPRIQVREVRAGSLNYIRQNDFHRVDLLDADETGAGECWSLFLAGPAATSWGFWDEGNDVVIPWREYLAREKSQAGVASLGSAAPHCPDCCDTMTCEGCPLTRENHCRSKAETNEETSA